MRYSPQIAFEDKEFDEVISVAKKKHGGNWHDFLLDLGRIYLNQVKGGEYGQETTRV